ncbi:hypothetical protein BDN70DRAFT_820252, partial [Pholiota conissans]
AIMDALDWGDLQSYSKMCQDLQRKMKNYLWNRLKPYPFLCPFFSLSEWSRFQVFQASSGLLISGSVALQLFNWEYDPNSSLDLYLEKTYTYEFVQWLYVIGYKDFSAPINIQTASNVSHPLCQVGDLTLCLFKKPLGARKIRVFSVDGPPLAAILSFHNSMFLLHLSAIC